ncbi:hypothetical protein AAAC51_22125 [Priestia megaterium]
MRIEVFPPNKSVKELNKETKEILRAGFSEVASLDTHLIHHNLEIAAAYKASDDKSNAYGFLVRKQNQHPTFRLTIFAPKSERDLTPFLEMGERFKMHKTEKSRFTKCVNRLFLYFISNSLVFKSFSI